MKIILKNVNYFISPKNGHFGRNGIVMGDLKWGLINILGPTSHGPTSCHLGQLPILINHFVCAKFHIVAKFWNFLRWQIQWLVWNFFGQKLNKNFPKKKRESQISIHGSRREPKTYVRMLKVFFCFSYFVNSQKLAKPTYWWSPTRLHCKIEKQNTGPKTLKKFFF